DRARARQLARRTGAGSRRAHRRRSDRDHQALTMASSTEMDVDLLVIGAGPAGSLLASLVRRENPDCRVRVVEKEIFPRHHIGESSIPSWRNILERAGVLGRLESGDFMRKVGTLFQWGAA